VGDLVVEEAADATVEQLTCIAGRQPRHHELGKSVRVQPARDPVTDREHHGDPVRVDPTRAEEQGIRRGVVEPVRVVDQAHDEAFLRGGREQAQGRDPHQERLDGSPVLLAERHAQCPGLRGREPVAP
jgi:hypothetical protein